MGKSPDSVSSQLRALARGQYRWDNGNARDRQGLMHDMTFLFNVVLGGGAVVTPIAWFLIHGAVFE